MKNAHKRGTQITTLIGTGTAVASNVRPFRGPHPGGCI